MRTARVDTEIDLAMASANDAPTMVQMASGEDVSNIDERFAWICL
jgi:hypothetical protein